MKIIKILFFILVAILAACSKEGGDQSSDTTGVSKAGSMAAFTVNGQYLYALDNNQLAIFNINTPDKITFHKRIKMPPGVVAETLYPFMSYLLIGSRQGVYIYDAQDASNPAYISSYEHIVSCDPVVANGNYAYSTLRSGNACRGVNELHILDIKNIFEPKKISQLSLSNPHGLAIDGDILIVCDGLMGFKIIDVKDRTKPILVNMTKGFNGYDVITHQKNAIITGSDGIYQYNYTNTSEPILLSKIAVSK